MNTTYLTEGTNLYYTVIRFGLDFATKNTDCLTQGTINKYLNAFSVLDTTEINHTYTTASPILSSVINAGSIVNSKLTNSSITLGGTVMALGSTISTLTNPLRLLGGYASSGIIVNIMIATPTLSLGLKSNSGGVLGLTDMGSGNIALIQNVGDNLYIDQSHENNSISIGTNSALTNVNIGSSTSIINYYGTSNFNNGASSLNTAQNIVLGGSVFTNMVDILPRIDTSGDGVIRIESNNINLSNTPYGIWATIIQNKNKNTYIDKQTSATGTSAFSPSVNMGTIIPNQNINLGTSTSTVNILGNLQYNNGRFHNLSKYSHPNFTMTDPIPLTWVPAYNGTVWLQNAITTRGANPIRITVNMLLSYWGSASSNHHISLGRQTNISTWATGYPPYDILVQSGIGSAYGIHHLMAGVAYESVNFTYIDFSVPTQGTFNYCVYLRSNSLATVNENIGNGQYCEIVLEELF